LLLSKVLYNIGNHIYILAIRIAALWNQKAKLWVTGREQWKASVQTFAEQNQRPLLWMHCASLGEFEQGRPVLEALKKAYPHYAFLVSFFSPSGYTVQEKYHEANKVMYLPVNTKDNADFFVKTLKPSIVLWVKYDYWSHYLLALHHRKIPLLLISAKFRNTQPFFRFYGSYWVDMLKCFTHLFVQDAVSEKLLKGIGITNVSLSGDTRFDRVVAIAKEWQPIEIISHFCKDAKVIVAGSTWEEDEEELCHFANKNAHLKFIIAPHIVDEVHLQSIEKLFKYSIRYTNYTNNTTENVLIINNIGMLSLIYKYATICYIGGGFGGDGVHNVLEAAVYGKPILLGTEYDKYKEAVDLIELEAAFSIDNALELEEIATELLNDTLFYEETCNLAWEYVQKNTGSSNRIIHYIEANRLLTKA
jgi:3-deoxy-D-manno-octulosonic-acid transferase